jgi:hypothetical protein
MNVRFEGLEPILEKLDKLGKLTQLAEPIFQGVGEDIRNAASPYPPETEANVPKPGGWYERGYGPRWLGGKGGRQTSQNLSTKWFVKPSSSFVDVGNIATYAPYVHGEEQAWFHGPRGWKKLKETAEELRPKILEGLEKWINGIIAGA